MLSVNGIPKLVIDNDEAVAAIWPSPLLVICVIAVESVVIVPFYTC
jgi:hypothetical protein